MDWCAIVKRHYDAGRYTAADAAVFVIAGKITPVQYEMITGQEYRAFA